MQYISIADFADDLFLALVSSFRYFALRLFIFVPHDSFHHAPSEYRTMLGTRVTAAADVILYSQSRSEGGYLLWRYYASPPQMPRVSDWPWYFEISFRFDIDTPFSITMRYFAWGYFTLSRILFSFFGASARFRRAFIVRRIRFTDDIISQYYFQGILSYEFRASVRECTNMILYRLHHTFTILAQRLMIFKERHWYAMNAWDIDGESLVAALVTAFACLWAPPILTTTACTPISPFSYSLSPQYWLRYTTKFSHFRNTFIISSPAVLLYFSRLLISRQNLLSIITQSALRKCFQRCVTFREDCPDEARMGHANRRKAPAR